MAIRRFMPLVDEEALPFDVGRGRGDFGIVAECERRREAIKLA